MSAFLLIYSPHGDAFQVPPRTVTVMTITFKPPVRAPRVAPPSLRASALTPPQVADLSRLLERLSPCEFWPGGGS